MWVENMPTVYNYRNPFNPQDDPPSCPQCGGMLSGSPGRLGCVSAEIPETPPGCGWSEELINEH